MSICKLSYLKGPFALFERVYRFLFRLLFISCRITLIFVPFTAGQFARCPALNEPPVDLCNFSMISTSPKQSETPLVKKRQRHKNSQSIFDEELLDPHAAGNLLHVLTITNVYI